MLPKLLLLFFVFSFLFRSDQSFDQDLGRHLKLGEIILQNKSVPETNLFSYTNPDFSFINTHWLFGVIAYLFSQSLGLHVFLVLKILIFLLSVGLILKQVPKQSLAILLPVGFIFLHILRERLELRPEIFSFLFTASTLFILEKFLKEKTKLIWILPFIQLIWVNTHIYFFVGLMLQAIFLIHTGYQYLRLHLEGARVKLLSIIFVLSILLSFINPNGLKGFLYPLNVNQNYGYTIVENQTMFLLESINFSNPNFIFVKISIGIIIVSLIITLIRRRIIIKNILLAISGIILALLNVRSFPYLIFLSLPATFENLSFIKQSLLIKFFNVLIIGLLIFESFSYLGGNFYKSNDDSHEAKLEMQENIKGALDFVISNNLEGPIFNNFDIGSYIIYRGYPKIKVFVDGRPEAYPKDFFQNTYIPMQSNYETFKTKDKELGFKTIIFSHTDQTPWGSNFLKNVVFDETWKLVFINDTTLVLVKTEVALDKKLETINLETLSPLGFSYDNHVSYLKLAVFLLNTGHKQAGERFIQKAIKLYPNSPTLKSFLTL